MPADSANDGGRWLKPRYQQRCTTTRRTSSSGQSIWGASAGPSWSTTGSPLLSSWQKKGNGTWLAPGSSRCAKVMGAPYSYCMSCITVTVEFVTECLAASRIPCSQASGAVCQHPTLRFTNCPCHWLRQAVWNCQHSLAADMFICLELSCCTWHCAKNCCGYHTGGDLWNIAALLLLPMTPFLQRVSPVW